MKKAYQPAAIEKKWQKKWENEAAHRTPDTAADRENFYQLVEFAYPSGNLHVGHWYAFAVPDIHARYLRMKGKNVLYPMGFDAFGLPAENAAIKRGLNPRVWTYDNMAYMRKQLQSMGASFDWSREVITCDPRYYRWTQWLFLELFRAGLVERRETLANWCPSCKTVLANEQVINNACERCGTEITKKTMKQWQVKITEYADRLVEDLKDLDWPEEIKTAQKNWIGRSVGASVDFLVPKFREVVLASNNEGKKKRLEKFFQQLGLSVTIRTPKELGLKGEDIREEGNLRENALEKARAYRAVTDLPILATDAGFFIEGEDEDPTRPKRNALGGEDEKNLSQKEIAQKMLAHYQAIAAKHGGKAPAYWIDEWVLLEKDETVSYSQARRNVTLTGTVHGELDEYLPVRCLYISEITGKPVALQTEEEEIRELEPLRKAVENLVVEKLPIFTTRLDTIYGCTYVVVAPEHPLLTRAGTRITNGNEVRAYQETVRKKTDLERTTLAKEKTGVLLAGLSAVHPFTHESLPLFVADYVLGSYGTGAVMAVPAHDERDFEFAQKFHQKILTVIRPEGAPADFEAQESAVSAEGTLIHSDAYSGFSSAEAREKMAEWLEEHGQGGQKVNYKMRDWGVSRQRYWGCPIPLVFCETCQWHAIPDEDLPVELPEVEDYLPNDEGESPLAKVKDFVETTCPKCQGPARRETDTLDTFVDSSWYFLRYCDPENARAFANTEKLKAWMPIDLYSGGAEHTTMHLLYSRFFHKALFDLGLVTEKEPYVRRMNRGLILGPDGNKMSKSKGNVIDPDKIVAELGADTMRLYLAFIGPYNETGAYPWNPEGIGGVRRFLDRVWRLQERRLESLPPEGEKRAERALNHALKGVEESIAALKMNTGVAALMTCLNALEKEEGVTRDHLKAFTLILAPFAPHMAEELWEGLGEEQSVFLSSWPKYDPEKAKEAVQEIVVQVNGKVRDRFAAEAGAEQQELESMAQARPKIQELIAGKNIRKIIVVPGKLINIVI